MDRDTQASEIRVVYPSGAHVFTRTGDDEWVLDLVGPPELGHMPRVTGYHDEDVLRVLTTFCTDSPTGVPADAEEAPCGDRSPLNYDHSRWAVCSLTKGHSGDHREGDLGWAPGFMPSIVRTEAQ